MSWAVRCSVGMFGGSLQRWVAGFQRDLFSAKVCKKTLLKHLCCGGICFATFAELRYRAKQNAVMQEALLEWGKFGSIAAPMGTGCTSQAATTSTLLPPLIFVPGYKGTVLESPSNLSWGRLSSMLRTVIQPSKNIQMEMPMEWEVQQSGKSEEIRVQKTDDYQPVDVMRDLRLFGFFTLYSAQGFCSRFFESLARMQNRPYFEFVYDWRRSPVEIALQLDAFVSRVTDDQELNPSGLKPQVIGHSFGALILLYLLTARDISYPATERVIGAASAGGQKVEVVEQAECACGPVATPPSQCYAAKAYNCPYAQEENGRMIRDLEFERYCRKVVRGTGFPNASERFHSVLMMAPPVRMTPYFIIDMLFGDPDHLMQSRTHLNFTSVYTFFPDRIYNPWGQWMRVVRADGNSNADHKVGLERNQTVFDIDPDRSKASWWQLQEREGTSNFWSKKQFAGPNYNNDSAYYSDVISLNSLFHGSFDKCYRAGIMVGGFLEDFRRFFHDFPAYACLGKGFASNLLGGNVGTHLEVPPSIAQRADAVIRDSNRGEVVEMGLDFTDPDTWGALIQHVGGVDAQLRDHMGYACAHAALFWKRIAVGTYGPDWCDNMEQAIKTRKKDESAIPLLAKAAQRSTVLTHDQLPPLGMILGNGQPTGEKIVLIERSQNGKTDFFFDGSIETAKVPGDSRLPANRIMPRDLPEGSMAVWHTSKNHCGMLLEVSLMTTAMKHLLAEAAMRIDDVVVA